VGEEFPGQGGGLLAGFAAGSVVAGYRLEEQVGAGGMAVVFRARDERLGRPVALKLLAPGLAADAGFRLRFIRESRAAAAVDDPHIIPVYEAGEAGGVLFLAMRYVAGGDVRSLVAREGPLPPARAAAVISAVASALDAAHAAGLVHRDVKPANMLVDVRPDRPDHVYLSDFGLSKGALSSAGLTGAGHFLGTANYVAPEQIQGTGVDGRADQYALACAAFELLAGEAPFQRDEGMAVIWAHLYQPPPSLAARRPGLPSAVDEVVARALAKAPADRYASCSRFADALREALGLAAYHAGPGDIPAADHPAADHPVAAHPGTEVDWPAAPGTPRTPGLTIPTVAATVSTPSPVPARAGPGPGSGQDQGARPARRRGTRRPGPAALAGIGIVAVAGVVAAVILASSPRSANSAGHGSAGSAGNGSASSRGQLPVSYRLASTITDPGSGTLGVHAAAFSPDGQMLATGDWNGSTYMWNVTTGSEIAALADPDTAGAGVQSVAFSADGKTLAVGDANGSTYLWDLVTWQRTAVLTDPAGGDQSVAFSPDGQTLASAGNGSTYLWDVATGQRTAVLTCPGSTGTYAVAFSPDGKTLAAGGSKGSTCLWGVATGHRNAVLTCPGSTGVQSVAFSPDGKTLATGGSKGSTCLWGVTTETLTATLTDPGGRDAWSVAFSPDGNTLATGDLDDSTYLWDVATRTLIATLTDPAGGKNVQAVAFSPDGKTLATGDANGSTYLWVAR
jgi:Tol biopolymer transport system component